MDDLADGVGIAAQGALLAQVVEPGNGKAAPSGEAGHFHESACLNCGTALTGAFCHACGQQAHLHRTLGAFLHDLLHGVLHFEGKTWRTLPMLARRPGMLTRAYIDGHRARYVSPMALFLFSIFLMFAVFQASGIAPPVDFSAGDRAAAEVSGATAQLRKMREEGRQSLAAMAADDPSRAELERDVREIDEQLDTLANAMPALEDFGGNFTNINTGVPFIDHLAEKWNKNPSLMLYKMQANSYKFSWLLIPLSLPFLALLFVWRRRFGMYDHAVFITYSLSFMTLLYVVLTVLSLLGVSWAHLALIGIAIPVWHIYRQLRGAYEIRRLSALWRTAAICIFIQIILLLFLNLLLIIGAF